MNLYNWTDDTLWVNLNRITLVSKSLQKIFMQYF